MPGPWPSHVVTHTAYQVACSSTCTGQFSSPKSIMECGIKGSKSISDAMGYLQTTDIAHTMAKAQ